MCLHPVNVGGRFVSCGKCPECLLAQELTLGFRGVANIGKYKNIASITLSYDDEHVPLVLNGIKTFFDDSEKYYCTLFDYKDRLASSFDLPSEFDLRQAWLARKNNPSGFDGVVWLLKPSFNLHELESDDWSRHLSIQKISPSDSLGIFPAGDIRHLQSWFKRFRNYYKRIFGSNPDMSYSAVLEYGPKTCRPHFHICLFFNDIDYNFITLMCQPEQSHFRNHRISGWKYGVINSCKIRPIGSSPDDAVRIAKYVAKYAKKSEKGTHLFERLGLVPTFRRCVSSGFNSASRELALNLICGDLQNNPNFIRWRNIVGEYVELDKLQEFSSEGLFDMAKVISDRLDLSYHLFGSKYSIKIPPCVLRESLSAQTIKLFYDASAFENDFMVYRETCVSSILWYAVGYVKAFRNHLDNLQKFKKFVSSRPRIENLDEVYFEFGKYQDCLRSNTAATYIIRDIGRYSEPSWLDK